MKETAAKFWVCLVFAELTTASTLGLPGWWGKGIAIAAALAGTAGVYFTDNKPLPPESQPPADASKAYGIPPEVHSGQ